MKFWKLNAILLTASLISGCASGLPTFPSDYIFVIRPEKQACSMHKIIKKDPVTVDKGYYLPWEECPTVYGFSEQDTPKVLSWIRKAQELAKKKCKD